MFRKLKTAELTTIDHGCIIDLIGLMINDAGSSVVIQGMGENHRS